MDAITDLLTDATTLWTAIMVLGGTIIAFVVGRRLFRKV